MLVVVVVVDVFLFFFVFFSTKREQVSDGRTMDCQTHVVIRQRSYVLTSWRNRMLVGAMMFLGLMNYDQNLKAQCSSKGEE